MTDWGSVKVRGARENNLRDISLDIRKRKLTVFTGVSGSGKSSLVFGTIAAESRRLIDETYTAFLQNFMPTRARPDVDALENLLAAILVDQESSGSLTGRHLSEQQGLKESPRTPSATIPIRNATLHNLQDVSVDVPRWRSGPRLVPRGCMGRPAPPGGGVGLSARVCLIGRSPYRWESVDRLPEPAKTYASPAC